MQPPEVIAHGGTNSTLQNFSPRLGITITPELQFWAKGSGIVKHIQRTHLTVQHLCHLIPKQDRVLLSWRSFATVLYNFRTLIMQLKRLVTPIFPSLIP
jgi:hypothetical protein